MASARVDRLADAVGAVVHGDPDLVVAGVTNDTAKVGPGSLFCCVVGQRVDGHELAVSAVEAGASALLVQRFLTDSLLRDVTQLVVADTRAALGPMAASFWGDPSRGEIDVVGVTGTNGKTTVVTLVSQLLGTLGVRCGVIGTLTGTRTTPEAPELQSQLRGFVESGATVAAIEVSSHALDLHRVDGTRFALSIFTNLGADHLDFHGTPERYFEAKARLFEPGLSDHALVNIDDVHGRLLRDAATVAVDGYSVDALTDLELLPSGATFTWRGQQVELPLAGRFNVSNALAAAEAVRLLGHDVGSIATALRQVSTPPGRFEIVDAGQPFGVVVDYAHTPDALENLLEASRELVGTGKLRVVFGCGGDRDAAKRPAMGAVASAMADVVMVTSDNPRSEDPAAIITSVKSGGTADVRSEIDRATAIAVVLGEAEVGDVVVIAGKGHEVTQTIGDTVADFDDRVVARRVLNSLGWADSE